MPLADVQDRPAGEGPGAGSPLLEVRDLVKHFPRRGGAPVRAVDGVSFRLRRGTTLGLVGESGCGKTTTGRMLVRLEDPTSGQILLDGADVATARGGGLKELRSRIQMIFQDPYSSLDPRMTVRDCIAEPMAIEGRLGRRQRGERVVELMEAVGLDPALGARSPGQLSGGQCQRVGVARALGLSPDIVVADEPTSALDVSVRAQAVNLLRRLQRELGLSFVFISHDLSTVRYVSDDVAVMYLGQIVEMGPADEVFARPRHPYTRALIEAVPLPDPAAEAARRAEPLSGEIPSPADPPSGCRFRTRCPMATDRCAEVEVSLTPRQEPGHLVACHYA